MEFNVTEPNVAAINHAYKMPGPQLNINSLLVQHSYSYTYISIYIQSK